MKKIGKVALILIILIAIIIATTPRLLRNYFNKNSYQLIERKASLESLSFNPFNGSVTAGELTIFEQDDSMVFSGFQELYINIHFLKLIAGKIMIEEIKLDSPFVHIINDNGLFNFYDLLPENDSTQAEVENGTEIEFEIENLQMNKGIVVYFEKEIDHKIVMNDLSFRLPSFAYNSQSANMDVQFIIDDAGLLSMKNNFYPEESRFVSSLKLEGLNIDIIEPYTKDYLNVRDISGLANADIKIEGEFKETTQIKLDGKVWLNDLKIMDTARSPFFKAGLISAEIKKVDIFKNSFQFNEVVAKNFFMRFDLMDSSNNILQAFRPLLVAEEVTFIEDSTANISNEVSLTTPSVFYSIDTFIVVNSTIKYRDYTLDNYFEYDITSINALADNIRSDNSQAKFSSTGVLNKHGKYIANLQFDPNNPLNFILDFEVKGFQMEDISPFTLTYAGHPIFKGELIYSGKTIVVQGMMDSKNKFTIYNLSVGDKVSKNVLYAMPLKFAVFLLKDKDGVVNLELPMDGNINDPNFKFGPLVWQIIKQNLQKIVAAPGKLLASQFGMNEEEIQFLAFGSLDTLLTEQSINTLYKLQEIMDNKPGLIIELVYYAPADIDIKNLAMQKAKTNYAAERFNLKTEAKIQKKVSDTNDKDIHFISYLKGKLAENKVPDDSLAITYIGLKNLLIEAEELRLKRQKSIEEHFIQMDSLYLHKFRFKELGEFPTFPVEQSGFVINFNME